VLPLSVALCCTRSPRLTREQSKVSGWSSRGGLFCYHPRTPISYSHQVQERIILTPLLLPRTSAIAWFAAIVLFAGALAPSYAQTIQKWVDEKGVTHYGDAPPPKALHGVRSCNIAIGNAKLGLQDGI